MEIINYQENSIDETTRLDYVDIFKTYVVYILKYIRYNFKYDHKTCVIRESATYCT